MDSSILQLILVGIVAGMILGAFLGGRGFGRFGNVLVGIVGAILGSFLYKQFLSGVLNLSLPSISLDLNQVVIALIGALLFVLILKVVKRNG